MLPVEVSTANSSSTKEKKNEQVSGMLFCNQVFTVELGKNGVEALEMPREDNSDMMMQQDKPRKFGSPSTTTNTRNARQHNKP
ncbi:hypothetical protein TNCT_486171 [Trichonephila clavata]|uniref:Uncharacterized protein n=1 Tax=Trichonephila clavata TaxID=2740835 RepID=A0A8X6HC72_TRICU|nr:hypothetical protein TNCT_486171 [Trichonephila clavata]